MTKGFLLIGPGIVICYACEDDYQSALTFAEEAQEALGLPANKMGNWTVIWL